MEFASAAMALSDTPIVQEESQPDEHLRTKLAEAARSINWSYAIFWSMSNSHPGVLTWKNGFYNGEIRTRKVVNSMELMANRLIFQRSEQLRALFEFLSGKYDHCVTGPASLSPEDLGDTEWFYMICMTYVFRPRQGLPGRSFASNEHVWLCNAHLAESKSFPRALLAKSASIQTILCIPLMGGVLELGTTSSVLEDQGLLNRATTAFKELKFPRCMEDSSANKTGDANYVMVLDDSNQNAMETDMAEGHEIGEVKCLFSNNLQQIIKEFDDFYGLGEELGVQPLQDSRWIMGNSFMVASQLANEDDATLNTPGDRPHTTSFIAWTRLQSAELVVPVIGEAQKLLKKVVAGRAWTNNGGESTAKITHESCIKKHVMSERRRREKLNEMFLALKSLVPTIRKMDRASILAETIAYLKELEQRVKELESKREPVPRPGESFACHERGITRKRFPAGAKRKKAFEPNSDMDMEHHWVLSKDGLSYVNVTVMGTEVLLDVQSHHKVPSFGRPLDGGVNTELLSHGTEDT